MSLLNADELEKWIDLNELVIISGQYIKDENTYTEFIYDKNEFNYSTCYLLRVALRAVGYKILKYKKYANKNGIKIMEVYETNIKWSMWNNIMRECNERSNMLFEEISNIDDTDSDSDENPAE